MRGLPVRRVEAVLYGTRITSSESLPVAVIGSAEVLGETQHLTANVREPVKVLLGLARITDGKVDLSFLNFDEDVVPGPESAQPTGSAHVSVSRFGERAEFTWSDFKRVGSALERTGR